MEKISEIFDTYRKPIYIGAIVLAVIVILYFIMTRTTYLQFMRRQKYQQEQVPGLDPLGEEMGTVQEDFAQPNEKTKVVIFYAPWCPHCKHMMAGEDSVWEKLKRKHGHRKDLAIEQVNCDEKPEFATKFGVKGFPTIMKIKKGKVDALEGARTLEEIEGFIDNA
jgi:thiol-disulfide isomerase/thioredoxin